MYQATARFFDSWFLWVGGVVPLPAARTILLLLAVNLVAGISTRLPRQRNALGMWLVHGGFIFLFIGGLWSSLASQEGKLWLSNEHAMYYAVRPDGSMWELPFALNLVHAQEHLYPGTQQAQSYQVRLEITQSNLPREVDLSLNAPVRLGAISLYIVSFSYDNVGRPRVGIMVAENPARWLPYVFSGITGTGLLLYCITMLRAWRKRVHTYA